MRTALFWVVTQRVLVISYRRFGTTYAGGSRSQCMEESLWKRLKTCLQTYYAMMPFWQTYNSWNLLARWLIEEISRNLCNLKVRNSPPTSPHPLPFVLIAKRVNPIYAFPSCFWKIPFTFSGPCIVIHVHEKDQQAARFFLIMYLY